MTTGKDNGEKEVGQNATAAKDNGEEEGSSNLDPCLIVPSGSIAGSRGSRSSGGSSRDTTRSCARLGAWP